jgi:hypothetical protein
MNSLSTNCIINILLFGTVKDMRGIYSLNKTFREILAKHDYVFWKVWCNDYKLLYGKDPSAMLLPLYREIVDTASPAAESYGSWHGDHADVNGYWQICDAEEHKKFTWFPKVKYCRSVWWYEYSWKISIKRAGLHKIWLRMRQQGKAINVPYPVTRPYKITCWVYATETCTDMPPGIFIGNGEGKWIDISVAVVKCDKPMDICMTITHHGDGGQVNEHHCNQIFAFSFATPLGDDCEGKVLEVIELSGVS